MNDSTGAQTAPSTASAPKVITGKDKRRALVSSFLGSTVEYYDFLLYASAASLVFPHLFFSDLNQGLGMVLSFVILLAGYIARPVGGLVFGHLGDKYGRKNILFVTLMMMGFVSIAIGLMPTYAQVGVAAPIILTVLRIVQGLAVGGEWAGAALMAAEHVGERNRGFAASVAAAGGPSGAVLATLVLALFSGLPQEHFFSWGWRIPFLFSAALVVIGLYLRYRVTESPHYEEARAQGEVHTGVPLGRLFTQYPKETLLGILTGVSTLFLQSLMAVIMVPYVVSTGAMSQQHALFALTLANFATMLAVPAYAVLSDRLGRKPVLLLGAVVCLVLVFPMFAMFNSGSPLLITLAFLVGNPIMQAAMMGPLAAHYAEKYATRDRYTGVSVCYQGASVLGAGTAPLMANWLLHLDNGLGTTNVAIYFVIITVVSGLAALAAKNTFIRTPKAVKAAA